MIQTQFMRLNNAPMGATLSVLAMLMVGFVSLVMILGTLRWTRGGKSK
jgi:spermidine/putrescine transport system permease protein